MAAPLLAARAIDKAYPGVQALSAVNLELGEGEVRGLLGENGAGKSTLLDVLSGVEPPDGGTVTLRGRDYAPADYREANRNGVFRVFQHQSLVGPLAVYENMYLSHEALFRRAGWIRHRHMRQAAQAILDETGHGHIDAGVVTSALDYSTRQVVEVLKALAVARLLQVDVPIILLDEPTTALEQHEVEFLFELIRRLKARASFVFVSHRLHEIFDICDRIEVMKDGRNAGSFVNDGSTSEADLHRAMVGRPRLGELYAEQRQTRPQHEAALEVTALSRSGEFSDVTFSLHRGEILGVAGLLGSGKASLARAVFSASWDSGTVRVGDAPLPRGSGTWRAIAAGLAYVPADRHAAGLILDFPLDWNVSLPSVSLRRSPLLDLRSEARDAKAYVQRLGIKTPSINATSRTLSGGNQQKVVLAKWLACDARIFLLDNPTFGVDVGSKEELYRFLRELVAEGRSVLLVSDDLLEVIGLSNRIVVMRDGRIADVVPSPPDRKPAEEQLIKVMAAAATRKEG